MKTSSNGNNFRVTGGEFPAQRPVTRSFHVFFDLRLNNLWVNNRGASDLRRYRDHYDVIAMRKQYTLGHGRFFPNGFELKIQIL